MRISANVFILAAGLLLCLAAQAQTQADPSATAKAAEAPSQSPEKPESPGQEFAFWLQKAARAYEAGDVEAWVEATEELHRLRPYNQDFMRHLVEGHAQLGNGNLDVRRVVKVGSDDIAFDIFLHVGDFFRALIDQ